MHILKYIKSGKLPLSFKDSGCILIQIKFRVLLLPQFSTTDQKWHSKSWPLKTEHGVYFYFLRVRYSYCFICRPSDSTVSEDAGIKPRTVATSALAARRSRSNHPARFYPHSARSHPHSARSHPLSARSHPHIDLIFKNLT